MKVLVLATWETELDFGLYDAEADSVLHRGKIDRIGEEARLLYEEVADDVAVRQERPIQAPDSRHALRCLLEHLLERRLLTSLRDLRAIGHRILHGGERFTHATAISTDIAREVKSLARLAARDNLHNVRGVTEAAHVLRGLPHIAIFDTAFFAKLPPEVFLYGIPRWLYTEHGIRKYGFNGTSHKYAASVVAQQLGRIPSRTIICHMGRTISIAALQDGEPIDTSMGFSPMDGVMMGTRPGSIDPGIPVHLLRELELTVERLDDMLNYESGLRAIAGSSDMREIRDKSRSGDEGANLAMKMVARQVRSYIGGYAALLGGLDCLVFTGGMGEKAWYLREDICAPLGYFGVKIAQARRMLTSGNIGEGATQVIVVPSDIMLQIGRETRAILG